ncbi:hypothetical protein BSFA1_82540 (plasmid) [Burkholderia sp. SFA1]|nr:hypothetical protein BSFA1_82540 [Burkholderia sp. SFA1]
MVDVDNGSLTIVANAIELLNTASTTELLANSRHRTCSGSRVDPYCRRREIAATKSGIGPRAGTNRETVFLECEEAA